VKNILVVDYGDQKLVSEFFKHCHKHLGINQNFLGINFFFQLLYNVHFLSNDLNLWVARKFERTKKIWSPFVVTES
jgi:hypothetical protein